MDYVVHTPKNRPDVVEVRYDCECGCKPRARYQQGSDDAGHEQCCCGRVHFVGVDAGARLDAYLDQKRESGEGADMTYEITVEEVTASWGQSVPVAFGIPNVPHKH